MPMYYFFLLLLLLLFQSCLSIDTITFNNSITENNILLSKKGIFALGFFIPGKSKFSYLGIWYHNLPEKTVVWVANRNTPINGSSGIFSINLDGNLVIYADHNQEFPLWSANVSVRGAAEESVAQILDSGNLVLLRNGETVWQSFDYPTDTTLPGLKVGVDRRLNLTRVLTSWTSPDDPGTGDWVYKLDPSGSPQYFLSKGSTRYWRSNPWPWEVKQTPSYIPVSANNQDEIYYTFLTGDDETVLARITITVSGLMQRLTWDKTSSKWRVSRSEPKYVYGHCGAFSILNANNFEGLECQCLPGYEPKSLSNWYLRDGSAGCVKKRNGTGDCGNGEGFVKVENVRLPDTSVKALLNRNLSNKVCEKMCLKNCSCKAFAKLNIESKGIGCLTWYGELMDTVQNTEGHDIYVRVDAKELAKYATKRKGFLKKKGLEILVISAVLAMFFIVLFGYIWMKKRKTKVKNRSLFSSSMRYETEENRQSDLLALSLRAISIATNNFDPANKLGQGGFGSVYKGQLDNGQEIAVKRLSRNSGQGTEEFENEIVLIAKLQHRNLVKLLGCCIQKDEQMLIYEYLPNKSLDHFIFDQRRTSALDWRKRFEIIVGIARGMLYLHHDSRLRIIHRDLKTSNVLLDVDMNPKISDFGMARIFKGDEQVQDKTNRVVGTYGYMAPEYAVFGKISTKSDVFSFGVILLEIISSKKCSSPYPEGPSLNLIGHVWELWKEEKALEMVDPSVREQASMDSDEVSRCIQIGLLCVQEKAEDRPNMSNVVLMLNGQASLPCPKHPAFLFTSDLNPTHPRDTDDSVNELTISIFHAR